MNVLISQRREINKYGGFIDTLEEDYVKYFEKLGIILIPVPNSTQNLEEYFKNFLIEGLILSGGNDINPLFYSEEKTRNLTVSHIRDETEKNLVESALKRNLPILGICRGMQFLNVFFKGRVSSVKNHVSKTHSINIKGKNFEEIFGKKFCVNSYHNQGIFSKDLSPELTPFAKSEENIIEGFYHPKYSVLGIQWHPERKKSKNLLNSILIKSFFQKKLLNKKKFKAIILAAGKGTRLGKYTKNLPKGMLDFGGKSLIERQIEILKSCGIEEFIIVKGYLAEKINIKGVKYFFNRNFATTNMVETLFCAEKELKGNVIVCYSDIIYDKKIIKKVLEDNSEVGVVVDKDYWEYWSKRLENPEKDIESLVVKDGKIIELGDPNCDLEKAKLRYVGIIKFSNKGVEILKKVYSENKEKYFDKKEPWLKSRCFKQAYMTCMLQELINKGYDVIPIVVSKGWLEFDTEKDYEKANLWKRKGLLKKFIDLGEC